MKNTTLNQPTLLEREGFKIEYVGLGELKFTHQNGSTLTTSNIEEIAGFIWKNSSLELEKVVEIAETIKGAKVNMNKINDSNRKATYLKEQIEIFKGFIKEIEVPKIEYKMNATGTQRAKISEYTPTERVMLNNQYESYNQATNLIKRYNRTIKIMELLGEGIERIHTITDNEEGEFYLYYHESNDKVVFCEFGTNADIEGSFDLDDLEEFKSVYNENNLGTIIFDSRTNTIKY